MRLELKLAIFAITLLLPKTHLYLSTNDAIPVAQTASSERSIPERDTVAHWDLSSTACRPVFLHSKQVRTAKLGQDDSDIVVVHAMAASGS
ncbi:hypothetical protein [Bradyrhizobium sp. C9]|uniref:hypothetical protein n=1 Tax=Bradyrhizobium sp. C9 TaxID=142585 RepID=UPI000BE9A1CE|nr:hypothetical protein [Bradyrhizobium sp. C9]PDT75009.1 hypothetical protein CO675_22205 [Bradyrhizobium sp. C9]